MRGGGDQDYNSTNTTSFYEILSTMHNLEGQAIFFLHISLVESSKDNIILRHVRGAAQNISITYPPIHKYYTQYYSEVDINDHDSAENTVSIGTSRWYLYVFSG